eukprot:2567915-Rhodomonas_salina.1
MAFNSNPIKPQNLSAPPVPRPSGAAEARMQSNGSHLWLPCMPTPGGSCPPPSVLHRVCCLRVTDEPREEVGT